ncbi:MAG: DUF5906 domain-containing protein [Bacteroides sp.]|nr:DUF5906 domain-containing protein [Eubacterium sp.]MCM1419140.1 DUF5906 domain-containing protein [Roseburia sp.]MCM1463227.1 DUF5906 domain-containing protein [Bacteroides sp.]
MNRKNANWLIDNDKIDEIEFCRAFCAENPLKCICGRFYGIEGEVNDNDIRADIASHLADCGITTNVAKRVKALFDLLRLYCHSALLPLNEAEIHVANGILRTDGSFVTKKSFCRNRFHLSYRPQACQPKHFLAFLDELLEPEDVLTLQEYLGYCLIPSTKGQAALFIIGNGGEGKSRLGVVLHSLFGESMIFGDFHRVETDRFFRYNLVDKLLMVDDDLRLSALKSTGYIKTIITAETPIDVEAKGKQSEQAMLYCRFLCFGNGSPKALYDKSEGFGRRLIILSTKPKPANRVDDPFICNRFFEEKEKIFAWLFTGLRRLIDNDFHFSLSEKTKRNIAKAAEDNCNIITFLSDAPDLIFGVGEVGGAELYNYYLLWCERNTAIPVSRNDFSAWLHINSPRYGIIPCENVRDRNGKRVRGFRGMSLNLVK